MVTYLNMATILSIVPYKIFPAKLGGQKGIALFNQYFAKEISLVAVSVKSNDPQLAAGYTLLNILADSPLRYINPFYVFRIKKIMRQYAATHILLEHPYYGWLGMLLKWMTGAKLVVHSHNIEALRWKTLGKWWWPILWQYEKFTHRRADYNFFIQDDDRQLAIKDFRLNAAKCVTITYGIEWNEAPAPGERNRCRQFLLQQHGISSGQTILLFNGTLNYKPNLDALLVILEKINPLLISAGLNYKIIICGRGLPDNLDDLKAYANKNIIYAGFTDDITVYFKGADVFINPVIDGGGIKTKLVEAIGYGTRSVSTENGSIGITPMDAGELLTITGNSDWEKFTAAVLAAAREKAPRVPDSFFQKFYWGNIAKKAAAFIQA